MLAKEEEVDVEVLWEDQQKINEFGRLNTRLTELRRDKLELKSELDKLDDATTELMTGDGDKVHLLLGEAFVLVEEEYATEFCEKKQEIAQARLDDMVSEEEKIVERQSELKKILYARFGSSINLET